MYSQLFFKLSAVYLAYLLLLLQAAYIAVMQNVSTSNRANYESLLRIYRETDLSQEKTRILGDMFIDFFSNFVAK